MHPFQTVFQPLFCLCMYYLLVLYIQTISSVAAVHFFFHKNGNHPSLEFVREGQCGFLCDLSLARSLVKKYWIHIHHTTPAWRTCVVPSPPIPTVLLIAVLCLWTAQFSSPQCIFSSSSNKTFIFLQLVSFCHIMWIKSKCLNTDMLYRSEG